MAVSTLLVAGTLALAACAEEPNEPKKDDRRGYGMGGVEQTIKLKAEFVHNKPDPWNLTTPESAVRSYLDWVSYSYRIGESDVATATQSPYQVVRTDGYVQANLQEKRVVDQELTSIEFGEASVDETTAVLPAKEKWTYSYVSIEEAGKIIGGPYKASYETTYHLVKSEGGWVVDDIDVKALGKVK